MELSKVTTRYSAHQDRLCIDGQSADGQVVSLWLTCRLMRHLIPLLIKLITPAADAADKATTLAEWALTSAKAQQKPQPPVTRRAVPRAGSPATQTPPAANWLVSTIELKSSPKQAVLVFRLSANQDVATIAFPPVHLRQWLSIVYRHWCGAGWPINEWPSWIREAESPSAPEGAVLH